MSSEAQDTSSSELFEIEDRCGIEVGRGALSLLEYARGGLANAVRSLDVTASPSVLILTGCFIPTASPPGAETDGPIGSAMLARGLQLLGIPVAVVTDENCIPVVDRAVASICEQSVPVGVALERRGSVAIEWTDGASGKPTYSHVISIERLGPASDGHMYSFKGEDRTSFSGPVHLLFSGPSHLIGIGDGGNELGMGNIPTQIVSSHIENGSKIQCRTRCDDLIVSGCANWGAFGFLAGMAIVLPNHRAQLLGVLDPEVHRSVLSEILSCGAVDGMSGLATRTIDGIQESEHDVLLGDLREIVLRS